jgi:hypothetical protein
MLLTFRQGIVNAPANFLQPAGASISLNIAAPSRVEVAFADENTNYLLVERTTVPSAWAGPFTPGTDYWLYWDINTRTGARTFGHTTRLPIVSTTAPLLPQGDQHWFDTTSNKMRVWNSITASWQTRLRVFAAFLQNGAVLTSMSVNTPAFTGSQVASLQSSPAFIGTIVFDANGDPVKKGNNKFFTTEDETVTGLTSSARVKLETIIVEARALTPIPAYGFVRFTNYHEVSFVLNQDFINPGPYGMVIASAVSGDVVSVVQQGVVTNPDWDWEALGVLVNTPLYIDAVGVLTPTVPPNAVIVGYVIDTNTILLQPIVANTVVIEGGGQNITLPLVIAEGGTGQITANAAFAALSPMTTNGDLITRIGGVPARLPAGTNGHILTLVTGAPTWQAPAAGGVDVPYTSSTEPSALLLSGYRDELYNPLGGAIQENQIGYLWYDQTTPRPTLKQRMNSYAYSDVPSSRGMPWDRGAYNWAQQEPLPADVPTVAQINSELNAMASGVYWSSSYGGVTWKLWYVPGNNVTKPVAVTIPLLPSVTPDYDKGRGTGYTVADSLSALTANLGGTGSGFSVPVVTTLAGGKIEFLGTIVPGSLYTNGVYRNVPLTGGTGTGARAHITVAGMTGNTLVAGSLYTPGIYYDVPLTGGTGTGATAHITVGTYGVGNTVTHVTFAVAGFGYTIGDVLSASTANIGGTGSGFSITVTGTGGIVTNVTIVSWDQDYASWQEVFNAVEAAWPGSKCEFIDTALYGRLRISHDTLEQFMLVIDYTDVIANTQWLLDSGAFDETWSAGGMSAYLVVPTEWGGVRSIWNAVDDTYVIPNSVMHSQYGKATNSNTLMHDPLSGGLLLNGGYLTHELVSGNTRPTTIDTYQNYLPFDADPLTNQTTLPGYGSGLVYLATKSTIDAPVGDIMLEAGDTSLTKSYGVYNTVQTGAEIQLNAGGTYFNGTATALDPTELMIGGSVLIRGGYGGVDTAGGYTYKLNPNNPVGTPPPGYPLGQFRGGDVQLMAGGLIGSGMQEDGTRGYVRLTAGKIVLGQSNGVLLGNDNFYETDWRLKAAIGKPGHTMVSRDIMGPARWAPTRSSESSYIPEGDSTNVFVQNFANTVAGTATTRTTSTSGTPYAGTNQRRLGFVSTGGAGSMAGVRQSTALFTGGKFIYHARFMIPTDVAGTYFFVGMALAAAFTNVSPTTINNIVGLTVAASPTTGLRQLVAVCNTNGTYSATNIVSDVDISLSASPLYWEAGEVFDLVIASTPQGHILRVQRVSANTGTQSYPGSVVFTSPTPNNGLKLAPIVWISNNATASAVAIDVMFQHVNDNVTSF